MEKEVYKFKGIWISDAQLAPLSPVNVFHREFDEFHYEGETLPRDCHVLFRRAFTLGAPDVPDARILISADDMYKLYVNGKFVAMGPAPMYRTGYYYNVLDITPYVREGENILAVHTYYQGLRNRVWVSADGMHGLIFDLLGEGGRLVVCSDGQTLTHRHTAYTPGYLVGYETGWMENYDFRAPEVGFEAADFPATDWVCATPKAYPEYTLVAQPTEPLSVYDMPAARTEARENGCIFIDLGQEVVGYPLLRMRGTPGARVLLYSGEECNPDGTVRHAMRCACDYTDTFTLSGAEDVSDVFDYRAFRYMEVILPPGVQLLFAGARVRHYPYRRVSDCRFPDERIRAVFDLCERTIHYGVQEGYLDCMSREKGQYFGDGCYSALCHALLTGEYAMMRKLMDNAVAGAFIDPAWMAGGPSAFMQEIAEYPLMIIILGALYLRMSADTGYIRSFLPHAYAAWHTYLTRYGFPLRGVDKWIVLDWPAESRDDYDFDLRHGKTSPGSNAVLCAWFVLAAEALEAMEAACNLRFDHPAAATLRRTLYDTFYDAGRHLFVDSDTSRHASLGANVMGALCACPDAQQRENLLKMIRQKRLSASNLFITPPMFFWLWAQGEEELLLSLICDENGWENMLREGASTAFEAFAKDKKWNTSLFHTMAAYPLIFLSDNPDAVLLRDAVRRACTSV